MIQKDQLLNNLTFMPDATRATLRTLTNKQIEATGTHMMVVNTLHLMIFPGIERMKELGGVHNLMNWNGHLLSDSGGFQVFSLLHTGKWDGKVDRNGATFKSPRDGTTYTLTPEKSIDVQMALGTDVLVVLDDCRKAVTTREDAEQSVDLTIEWAERAKSQYMSYPESERAGKLLTCVVQGANFKDLREKCAKALTDIGFDGFNFGGYVLDDEGELVVEQMDVVIKNTPDDGVKYAMGVGKPEDILEVAKLGYTLFDTVLPTRNARHGTIYTTDDREGVLKINNSQYATDMGPIDSRCDCESCVNHSRAYIHHLLKLNEMSGMALATIHNVRFYQRVMEFLNAHKSNLETLTFEEMLHNL